MRRPFRVSPKGFYKKAFPSALWRRLLFSLSLALACLLFWSCSLPTHLGASFFSLLALFVCTLLGRCSGFSASSAEGFFNSNRLDAFVVNDSTSQQNQIHINEGGGSFEIPTPPPSFPRQYSRKVTLGDLDGDGDLDAFVVNTNTSTQQNQIYINEGGGSFEIPTPPAFFPLHNSHGVALGDLNGNGDLDAFVVNDGQQNQIYANDGSGGFTNAPVGPANNSQDVALGDLDGDSDFDAFVVNNSTSQQNQIYTNDGSGSFPDPPTGIGPSYNYSSGVALGDLDGDGNLDAFVVKLGLENEIYTNDGSGVFSNAPATSATNDSRGVALGDLDGDGYLDAFVVNRSTSQQNQIYTNDGSGTFTPAPAGGPTGPTNNSQGVALGDLDGDGDLDAFVANDGVNQIYINDGSGTFTPVPAGGPTGPTNNSRGVALGDLD